MTFGLPTLGEEITIGILEALEKVRAKDGRIAGVKMLLDVELTATLSTDSRRL